MRDALDYVNDLKRIVRQRMIETGERYVVARAAVVGVRPLPTTEVDALIGRLAVVGDAMPAFEKLKALPRADLRAAATRGMSHESWRVRRSCASLLDDVDFTDETWTALRAALDDPVADVRRAVVHTLTCQHCKPEGCILDVRGVYERMATDPSAKVRAFVMPHTWGEMMWGPDRVWAEPLLRAFAEGDPSPKLRAEAAGELRSLAQFDTADEARRQLPEPLRSKTERHPRKWVAVVDGQIVSANRSAGSVRRELRGLGKSDATLYWVNPT